MTKDEVRGVIEALVTKFEGDFNPPIERLKKNERFDPPTRQDWEFLEAKFKYSFAPNSSPLWN